MQWTEESIRKLIQMVQSNQQLYAKSNKQYRDTIAKNLTWETIGKSLGCTGDEASKKFKSVRDTFVKELKKVRENEGRSGDGTQGSTQVVSAYTPSYEFYYDLLFLTEHVTERRTTSNMKKDVEPSLVLKSIDMPALDVTPASTTSTTSISLGMVRQAVAEANSVVRDTSTCCSDTQDISDLESVAQSTSSSSSGQLSIREKVLIKTPQPDRRFIRKRDGGPVDDNLELKKTLAVLSSQAKEMMSYKPENSQGPDDGFGKAVADGLQNVPKESKFRCMGAIMQVLDLFANGKNAIVSEEYFNELLHS